MREMIRRVFTLFLIMLFTVAAVFFLPAIVKADVSPAKGKHSMPATGNVKALAIRVGFKDYPLYTEEKDEEGNTVLKDSEFCLTKDQITDRFLGTDPESASQYPYESLSAYYERSSYGKLNITLGDIVDFTSENTRDYYEEKEFGEKEIELMREILDGIKDEVDLSEYDSNNDGVADAVYIFYSEKPGPPTCKTFSPHCKSCADYNISLNGMKLTHFVMLGTDEKSTLMHETGHLLGLPDYYSRVIGEALFGTSDMMYDNSGDHCGFSKWILGWLTDENVIYLDKNDAGSTISLTPVDSLKCQGKKLAVLSNPKADGPYNKYLLVEYVSAENDMADLIGGTFPEGFRIFKVDAEMSGGYFLKNNDHYETSLLQVLNHDYSSVYDSIFREGMEVTPFTDPSSAQADGTYTGFFLIDFNTGKNNSFKLDYKEKPPETTTSEEKETEKTVPEEKKGSESKGKRIRSADTGEEKSFYGYLIIIPIVLLYNLVLIYRKKVNTDGSGRR